MGKSPHNKLCVDRTGTYKYIKNTGIINILLQMLMKTNTQRFLYLMHTKEMKTNYLLVDYVDNLTLLAG